MSETTARGRKPWNEPGDPVDWTTPNSTWRGHEFCSNCGWDAPGCGCPRDCPRCQPSGLCPEHAGAAGGAR